MNTFAQILMVVVLLANSLLPIPGLLQQAETPTPTPQILVEATPAMEVTDTPELQETPNTEFVETPVDTPTETPIVTLTPSLTPTVGQNTPADVKTVKLTLSHSPRFIAKDERIKIKWQLESVDKTKFKSESNYQIAVQLPNGFIPDEFSNFERDLKSGAFVYPVEKEHGVIELLAPVDQPGPFEIRVDVMTSDYVLTSETIFLERAERFEVSTKGNEISALEGKLKIKIPPGAFKRDAQVWVHTLSDFSKVDYLISENTVELVADYGDETEEIHTFEQPLEISMPYDAEKYRGNESMITMFYYDKTRWQWSPILS